MKYKHQIHPAIKLNLIETNEIESKKNKYPEVQKPSLKKKRMSQPGAISQAMEAK